jgi:translation initiation factor IF-2
MSNTKKGPVQIKDFAKEIGVDPKVIINILRSKGYQHVRSDTHKMNKEMEEIVRAELSKHMESIGKELQVKKQIYQAPPQKPPVKKVKEVKKEREVEKFEEKPKVVKKISKSITKPKRKEEGAPTINVEKITITGPMSVKDFAEALGIKPEDVIQKAFQNGILITINQILDVETLVGLAGEFGVEVELSETAEEVAEEAEEGKDIRTRPPIVTVMGHVDHGKTTLLDTIRKTNVAEKEVGGITQHIGAYQVKHGDYYITFIDTPGHEAFTTLRARGAQVTDIVVLVVAADDGVMPQTVEAINHARTAGVPIIVAINKIDLPGADPQRVKNELMRYNLVPEEYGGDTIVVEISAKKGIGIDDLLDAIILKSEEMGLKAPYDGRAKATIIESRLDKGLGPVGSAIVRSGTLKVGDAFWCGPTYGRVRMLLDDKGRNLKEATPSTPVLVVGFEEVPRAGDTLIVVEDLNEAREKAEEYKETLKYQIEQKQHVKIARMIQEKLAAGEKLKLPIIVKADTQGSAEAIVEALSKMKFKEIEPEVIHYAVGNITVTDVELAIASNGIIVGFNTKVDSSAKDLAEERGVPIRLHRIIYSLLDDVRDILSGQLEPEIVERKIGEAEVRAVFQTPSGNVAGCYVLNGVIRRDAKIRVKREGNVIAETRIASLKRFKDDVREVQQGYECGIKLENFEKFKVGDILEAFVEEKIKRELTPER